MSENGPREGTKDLPRRDPESGHRSIEPDSPSGLAYARHSREAHRRRLEIRDLVGQGLSPLEVGARYRQDHPAERPVTIDEVLDAVGEPAPTQRRSR
jgi:hypothetical protein